MARPVVGRVPLECEEQVALFEWAKYQTGIYPELEFMYAVPNGGSRNKAEAGHMKAQGVKSGVPDIVLPAARGEWHGLYIELKRLQHGTTSENQVRWIEGLTKAGYLARVCKGWNEARELILSYLNTGR